MTAVDMGSVASVAVSTDGGRSTGVVAREGHPSVDQLPLDSGVSPPDAGDVGAAALLDEAAQVAAPHVVGVDLSLTSTGVACPHGCDTIVSTGHKDDTLLQRSTRLRLVKRIVLGWCAAADLVVIEAPSYASQHGSMHDRAGLWWLVVSSLHMRQTPVVAIPPKSRAKYATGNGNATKDQVLTAVVRRFPDVDVSNNNEADAVALMAMGLDALGHPLAVMPDVHRSVLAKIDWPEVKP